MGSHSEVPRGVVKPTSHLEGSGQVRLLTLLMKPSLAGSLPMAACQAGFPPEAPPPPSAARPACCQSADMLAARAQQAAAQRWSSSCSSKVPQIPCCYNLAWSFRRRAGVAGGRGVAALPGRQQPWDYVTCAVQQQRPLEEVRSWS